MSSTWENVDPKARLILLAELASSQHGLFSAAQASAAGLPRPMLTRFVKEGRLVRLQRGVYGIAGVPSSRRRLMMQACLAAGPDAVVSHFTAAELHGLDEIPVRKQPQVLVATTTRLRTPGALLRRTARLEESERTIVDGVPATTPLRTWIDLADALREDVLELVLMDACRRSLIDPNRVTEAVKALSGHGRPGVQKLRRIIAAAVFGEFHRSKLEARALRILKRRYQGIRSNYLVIEHGEKLGEVDLALPDLKIAIECDGEKFHCTREQKAEDRAKTRRLRAAGWIVLRLWWRHTLGRPDRLFRRVDRARRVADLRRTLSRPVATPRLPSTYFYAPPPPGWA